jgi:predicted HicB family RNase H-like nuclease
MTSERDCSQDKVKSRIPDFQSREEEAEFWDTHDFTEFLDESQLVKLPVRRNLSKGLTVRLDQQDRAELERRAAARGIGSSTLVRMWIKEQLRQPAGQSAAS